MNGGAELLKAVLWYCTLPPSGESKQSVVILLCIKLLWFFLLLIFLADVLPVFVIFVKPLCETAMLCIHHYE